MASSLTIYCLKELTDYFNFERLCNDLMSLEGYPSIEPLGGFSDKGRDAINVDSSEKITIFAYSVREDWRAKLSEDADKISRHGHDCNELVFITTSKFTASERDEAVASIKNDYSWNLELFGCERLRILLDVKHPRIKRLHPQIFPPEFLKAQENIQRSSEQRYLFISSVIEDRAFSDWLVRRLTAEGYLVWNERLNLLGGESFPDHIDDVIKNESIRMIALYSEASLQNPEVMRQRTLALNIGKERNVDFLIPINVDGIDFNRLDFVTRSLKFISFDANWASGLHQFLEKLESINVPKFLSDGKVHAVEMLFEEDVISQESDALYSNILQFVTIPPDILYFKPSQDIPKEVWTNLRHQWAYRRTGNLYLSFHAPPVEVANRFDIRQVGIVPWSTMAQVEGINSYNLVSELLRKSLIVKCHESGLQYCPETKMHYFPFGLFDGEKLFFTRPDNSRTYVKVAGQRKYYSGELYQYFLAPSFFIDQNLNDDFALTIGTRVRLADENGTVLPRRTAVSRRKHLCKNWWNREWFNRFIAICEFLSDAGEIKIGQEQNQIIVINSALSQVVVPIGIDEDAIDNLGYLRNEFLASISETPDDSSVDELDDE